MPARVRVARVPDSVRKRTFGRDPAAYDRARLGYPERLYRILERRCKLGRGASVFEIGPGTGKATREILRRRPGQYVAVEADRRLARYLVENVIRGRSGASVVVVPFERAQLPPASFDLGLAASSFHWLPERRSLRRVVRLLAPGGWWASWNNHHGDPFRSSPFHAALQPLYRELAGGRGVSGWTRRRARKMLRARLRALTAIDAFDRIRCDELRWSVTLTTEQVRALWASFSDIAVLPFARRTWFLDSLAKVVAEQFGGRVRFPVVTTLFTARRR